MSSLLVVHVPGHLLIVGRYDVLDGERFLLLLLLGLDAGLTGDPGVQDGGGTQLRVGLQVSAPSSGVHEGSGLSLVGDAGLRCAGTDLSAVRDVGLKVGQLGDVG